MIDLSLKGAFPLTYILAASRASFKVGRGGPGKEQLLDLIINTPETEELDFLIGQVNHYLNFLNREEAV